MEENPLLNMWIWTSSRTEKSNQGGGGRRKTTFNSYKRRTEMENVCECKCTNLHDMRDISMGFLCLEYVIQFAMTTINFEIFMMWSCDIVLAHSVIPKDFYLKFHCEKSSFTRGSQFLPNIACGQGGRIALVHCTLNVPYINQNAYIIMYICI